MSSHLHTTTESYVTKSEYDNYSMGVNDQLNDDADMKRGDSEAMTVHRRKMMRRAANRRSAQLSRARKKVSEDQN
jgi:hypothetical protein